MQPGRSVLMLGRRSGTHTSYAFSHQGNVHDQPACGIYSLTMDGNSAVADHGFAWVYNLNVEYKVACIMQTMPHISQRLIQTIK